MFSHNVLIAYTYRQHIINFQHTQHRLFDFFVFCNSSKLISGVNSAVSGCLILAITYFLSKLTANCVILFVFEVVLYIS